MKKEKLKELRNETGLSQEDFAKKLGVKPSRYRAWEYGHNGIDPLIETHIKKVHKEIINSPEYIDKAYRNIVDSKKK